MIQLTLTPPADKDHHAHCIVQMKDEITAITNPCSRINYQKSKRDLRKFPPQRLGK